MSSFDSIRAADEALRDFRGKAVRSACYAPFVALYLTTTGDVIACCQNRTSVLGNVKRQRLHEIWNGGQIASLRQALIDYRFDRGCAYCEWQIKSSKDNSSFRTLFDQFPVPSLQPEWPAQIDFVGSNVCNFECVMCYGTVSSSIRKHVEGLPPLPKAYDDQFFQDLRSFLPHLRWMNFLGGEPFLSTEAHRIWDMMIADRLSIPCHVTTNASYYNARVERILDALPMHFAVSLDGATKETFEAIRRKSTFEVVMANLRRFHAYTQRRGTSFHIAFCLMRQNWHEFLELLRIAERLDCDVVVNTVIDPSYCSLFTLPTHELRIVVAELDRQNLQATAELRRNRAVWDAWIEKLRAATQAEQSTTAETVMSSNLALHDDPLTRAGRLAERREYAQALVEAHQVEADDPDHYFALTMSAYVRGQQGKWAEAREDLRQAIRITDKLPDAFLNLARIDFRQGDLTEALENARRASELVIPEDLRDAQVHALLALVYLRQWRLVRAYRAIAHWAALPRLARSLRIQEDAGLHDDLAPAVAGLLPVLLAISQGSRAFRVRVGGPFVHARSPGLQLLRPRGPLAGVLPGHSEGGPGQRNHTSAPLSGTATLRVESRSRARLVRPDTEPEQMRIAIEHAEPGAPHSIQLNYSGVALVSNRSYSIAFRVRADAPRHINWGIAMAREPWTNLGLYRTLQVGREWQEVREPFACRTAEECSRVHFDLADSGTSVEFASLVVVETGAVDRLGMADDRARSGEVASQLSLTPRREGHRHEDPAARGH